MKNLILKAGFVLIFFVFLTSCDDEDNGPQTASLDLNISNLENLGADEQYEGWIIVNGSPVSTGTFTVNDMGQLSQSSFTVDQADLDNAAAFVLSIEPVPDTDPAPSAIKLLGGDFSGSTASVSVNHGAALGSAFSSASGKYLLATPTTIATDDETSGVWFIDNSSGSAMAGLNLPGLPSGWVYEGWAVIDGSPLSTGTFTMVGTADNSAPFSGTEQGPAYPGEDFVQNAPAGLTFPTDLTGKNIVISIEPSPDNSAAPFQLKPLVKETPAGAMPMQVIDMDNTVSSTFPTGTVTR